MLTLTDHSDLATPGVASDDAAGRDELITLQDVLTTIADFSTASIELVAWEFSVETPAIERVWADAIGRHLITLGPVDGEGESPATLTRRGAALLAAQEQAA